VSVICRDAYVGSWHEATDHILIWDGRFRGEADIRDHVGSNASAVGDPFSDIVVIDETRANPD